MDAYEDLIDIKKDDKNESDRSIMPFFFIKPHESYNLNYTLVPESKNETDTSFPRFPFPNDFENYESFSKKAKEWMDSTLSLFIKHSKAPLLPIPTTLFYRTLNLDFWPHDKNALRTLAKKLGPHLLPLRPKNLLELEDKIINNPTNITDIKYNSNEEEIFKDGNNFSEPDYNGRPLPYKYHFSQNNFFQLIPPEPIPEYYDTFEQYNTALKNWYNVTNTKYPGYKKIKKVEELGNELGIKPVISSPSMLTSFAGRNKIDKMNEENRKKLFNKGSKACTIDQLNKALNVTLSQTEFDRLTSLNTQLFESTFNTFAGKNTNQPSDSMTELNKFFFDEESLELLNENSYEEIAFIIDDLIEYGPSDYILKSPIQNYNITSQMIFVDAARQMSLFVPQRSEPRFSEFPLFLLNNESSDQFIQYCDDTQIDFSTLIKTSEDFIKFIKLCDSSDRVLCQKFVYVFKNLFSSPSKFDIYVRPLIGQYNKDDCYSIDMKTIKLLKKFLKIVEGASEFDDEKIPRMMFNLNIDIDEETYVNSKKSDNEKDFNRREVLNIYKLCFRCSLIYTFTNLFVFKKWNSNIIFEYITEKVLNPLLYQLSKKIMTYKKDIITCYINDTITKLDTNVKKANENVKNGRKQDDDDDTNIGNKLMSFSSTFLSFADASKSLSEQFVIPTSKSQLRIPIFVVNQDNSSGKKVSTIDDATNYDNQDKTLTALSFNNKAILAKPSQPSKNMPSLIDDQISDSNLTPLIPHPGQQENVPNFENMIANIDSGLDEEYPSHIVISAQDKDEVEKTMNSLQHSISAMSNSFKSLPKIGEDRADDDDNEGDEEDDYMNILTKTNKKAMPPTSSSKKSKKRKKKKSGKSGKKTKNLAYRIIFLVINMDYPNLHNALFHPSPINFFNEISKLEKDNAFMNLAGGFYNKTEKLKSSFLCSDAFKNMQECIINFDVNKLDMTNVNFARRSLMVLNRCNLRLFSRSQITSLLKMFTSHVSRFNFALCPIIALHFRNREKFVYKTTITSDSKVGVSNGGPGRGSGAIPFISSIEQNFGSLDNGRKTPRKPPLLSSREENYYDIDPSQLGSVMPASEPAQTTTLRSSFRFKKDKKGPAAKGKRSAFDESQVGINECSSASRIDQFESKARSFDPNKANDIGQINGLLMSSSYASSTGFPRKEQQLRQRRQSGRRKNADSIFGLGGIRVSFSNYSASDSESALSLAAVNSDSSLLLREEDAKLMQPLKPQYSGDEWMSDATMIASYLASLVYSVNSACFPYLMRAVDLLFCSPRINFPRKFWGTFCGALSVAEVNAWIFLRSVFKLGFVQVLPPEFTLFFPAVFNYKTPYIVHESSANNDKDAKGGNTISPSTANSSGNCLTFENLNKQIEKAKQMSLKVTMFTAIVTSAAEISLQYLEALLLTDKAHLQKVFSRSVDPSLKIEKLNSNKNLKKDVNQGNNVNSSIDINFYSSSYYKSLSNIVTRNVNNYRKIVEKLKSYGNKFQALISIFPAIEV